MTVAVSIVVMAGLACGCEDIRRFSGRWQGPVSSDPNHAIGFQAGDVATVDVETVTRVAVQLTVALPRLAGPMTFEPIRHAADDALGQMRLEGEPLRSFLGYLQPPDAGPGEPRPEPYLAVVSLFAEDRIDLRVIRRPDETYGVFELYRFAP